MPCRSQTVASDLTTSAKWRHSGGGVRGCACTIARREKVAAPCVKPSGRPRQWCGAAQISVVTRGCSCSSKRQLPPKRPLRSCPVRPTRSASPCYPRSSLTGPPIARGVNFALAAPQRTRRGGPAVGRSSRRAVASPLRTPLRTNAKPPRKHASRTHREQGFEQGLGAPTRKDQSPHVGFTKSDKSDKKK